MGHDSIRRGAGYCTVALLLGALVFLQIPSSEKDLLPFLLAYAAIAVAGVIVAVAGEFPKVTPDGWCVTSTALFCGYVVVRALTSPVPYAARADLYLVLAALTVYALVATPLSTPRKRLTLVGALLLFALVQVVVSATQVMHGGSLSVLVPALETLEQGRVAGRGAGFYVGPSHLAGMLEVVGALGLAVACWSRRSASLRVCAGYLCGACYVGIAFSGSRGGYVAATTSILVFAAFSLLLLATAGRRKLLIVGGSGLLVASVLGAGMWMLLQEINFAGKLQRIGIDAGRLDLWRAAIDQWKLQPWTGTGSGTYLFYGREFRQPAMQQDPVDVHNDYLHLLAEYGIAGAAAFLFLFVAHARRAWLTFAELGLRRVAAGAPASSDRLALNIGALSAVAAYVVHSAVDYNLHVPANALLMACVFGIIAAPGLPDNQTMRSTSSRLVPRFAVGLVAAVLLIACARVLPGEYFADRARIALWDEDPESAAEFALKALDYERRNPHVYFYLGRALRASAAEIGQPEEQVSLYETAIRAQAKAQALSPLDAAYPLEQAQLYDKLGRFEEAERMFELAKARDPRANYITREYNAHQELWKKSRTQSPPAAQPPPAQP